jgi:hypothetical protein
LLYKRWKGPVAVAVRYVINCFSYFAYAFYDAFCAALPSEDDPTDAQLHERAYRQHQAINRLCNEWKHLEPLIYAARDPHLGILQSLADAARPAQQGEPSTIYIPIFGRRFGLGSFRFAPGVHVIGVPFYNLETPWDWQVLWHEIGGQIVRLIEQTVDSEGKNEIEKEILPQLSACWQIWRDRYIRPADSAAPLDRATTVRASPVPLPGDEPVAGLTVAPIKFEQIDQAGWIAELLEDAYCVMSLGPATLATLKRVLRQHYRDPGRLWDNRHPVPGLRLDMARVVAQEMGFQLQSRDVSIEHNDLKMTAAILCQTIDKFGGAACDQALLDTADELASELAAGQQIERSQASIKAIVIAASQAFDSHPEAATAIAQAATAALQGTIEDSQDLEEKSVPAEKHFGSLFSDKTWSELLSEPYYEVDEAVYYGEHTPYQEKLWLRGIYIHGNYHWLYHSLNIYSH